MFNWVCPRCGRENSPSYTECPDCKERDLKAQAEAAAQEPPPQPVVQQQSYQNPPQTQEWQVPYQPQQAPQAPVYNPAPQYAQAPPQYAPQQYQQPQYAPPQQYAQPPQQPVPQQPQQYAPPQQQPSQYAPQQPTYAQTQPVYAQQPPQQYAPPQQPQYAPPPQQPQYAPPVAAQTPPAAVAPPKPKPTYVPPSTPALVEKPEPGFAAKIGALPTPLLMLLFAALFLLVGAGIYYGYQRFGKTTAATSGLQATASTKNKVTNPIQKYIEVVGIRLTTDAKKKPIAKFVIVNHASTELNGLGANVTLWASTSRSEEDAVGSFTFNVENIGPYESKEVSAPFKTKLKMYELPDWQNATPEIQITSPQQ